MDSARIGGSVQVTGGSNNAASPPVIELIGGATNKTTPPLIETYAASRHGQSFIAVYGTDVAPVVTDVFQLYNPVGSGVSIVVQRAEATNFSAPVRGRASIRSATLGTAVTPGNIINTHGAGVANKAVLYHYDGAGGTPNFPLRIDAAKEALYSWSYGSPYVFNPAGKITLPEGYALYMFSGEAITAEVAFEWDEI